MRPYVKENQEAFRGVMVFAEYHESRLNEVTLEGLPEGRRIADKLGTEMAVAAIGYGISKAIDIFKGYGTDKVFLVDDQRLKGQKELLYSDILVQIIKQYRPEIFIIGSTYFGRAIAPKIASRLNTGLTADCVEFDIDTQTRLLIQKRPAYSGQLMAEIICPKARPQMATFQQNVIRHRNRKSSRDGAIIRPGIVWNQDDGVTVNRTNKRIDMLASLLDAKVVIGVGSGIQSPGNLEKIYELAGLLNARIGATRAVVEAGWLGHLSQIGQTGKSVSPDVYLAWGISGAMQHMVGIKNAGKIFAINHDKNAPIFEMTDYGMVGDIKEILPLFISEIQLLKQ